ncbi:MAG: glycine dehydrogenase (aminomethyl-transferring) [Bdellovibrionales bacterium CG10_big_fil_rev_8_21_14_0_10_45_34]|nr:MAG: glycine dehydrogenase (aminomethyl-transferring) [Bdellovibrionales bacterium CG10_big_fil_rev_8_21_14_0_10_45_34]
MPPSEETSSQAASSDRRSNGDDSFSGRHIGPSEADVLEMLRALNQPTLESLCETVVPKAIQLKKALTLPSALSESQALAELKNIMLQNKVVKSYIGMGYHETLTPSVIQRNILENPGWYTQYTPYQAEISQGRLEALLNFQTLVSDLTGLPVANASLLDEGTAAAEAMGVMFAARKLKSANTLLLDKNANPQTIDIVRTRAEPIGVKVELIEASTQDWSGLLANSFGLILANPDTVSRVSDYTQLITDLKSKGLMAAVCTDLLALTLLKSPGEMGADIAFGSSQRLGVPLGFGGPHAAFFAVRDDLKRTIPGRIVGVSKDSRGNRALRLALQTREQHIRREKATSNICTAQVLLAVMASMYAVYHGPKGLKKIAEQIAKNKELLKKFILSTSTRVSEDFAFDSVTMFVNESQLSALKTNCEKSGIELRWPSGSDLKKKTDSLPVTISLGETFDFTRFTEVKEILSSSLADGGVPKNESKKVSDKNFEEFSAKAKNSFELTALEIPTSLKRTSEYLQHNVFNSYHSETELLRYITRLQSKDLSLAHSMIPLGSCTMKLNATSEMLPVSWSEVSQLHPYTNLKNTQGYLKMFDGLEDWLSEITGFSAVSLQPNAGSQGEYAGLLVIRKYFESRGEQGRSICLIPASAHGTNPASAVMAGYKVVSIQCDKNGNVDLESLRSRISEHGKNIACIMITYPSTHGVFEESIVEICSLVHEVGAQVYMDGANMNAQIGLCRPSDFGADVCHLNLHKTFCIPHGGGGPGVGPIGVKEHLKPYLPALSPFNRSFLMAEKGGAGEQSIRNQPTGDQIVRDQSVGMISAAPWGSASILPISWMYIRMMGASGLKKASQIAILNANYIAERLKSHFPILYTGQGDYVAHECILDFRQIQNETGITVEDVAKRLMDYGFHAPTMSWPVAGTLMVEPTESESKAELDAFCEAMIQISGEIVSIREGKYTLEESPLRLAPHTAEDLASEEWTRKYTRQTAVFPTQRARSNKFWPTVNRVDNAFGDRNLFCACS